MSIKVGDRLPEATFVTMSENGPAKRSVAEIFRGKRVVLFAVPGAFTPTCHLKHMPGFIQQAEAFRARGIDTIACVAVNDIHVLTAWGKASGADGKILFLADGNGEFTKAVGMELDGTAFGMGRRSQRYAMLVEDRVVNAIHLEAQPGIADEVECGEAAGHCVENRQSAVGSRHYTEHFPTACRIFAYCLLCLLPLYCCAADLFFGRVDQVPGTATRALCETAPSPARRDTQPPGCQDATALPPPCRDRTGSARGSRRRPDCQEIPQRPARWSKAPHRSACGSGRRRQDR